MCRCNIQKSSFVKDCCASCSLLNWSGLSGTRPKEWEHAWSGLRAHNSDSVSYKSFSVLSQMMICGLSWFLTFLTDIPSWKLLWCAQKHTHVHVAFLILQARLVLCISWGYINQISVWAMCCSKATNSVNYLTTHTHARARTDACISRPHCEIVKYWREAILSTQLLLLVFVHRNDKS